MKVRDLLRSSVRQAASMAAQKSSAQSPRGSTLMWSLLRTSLKQQGEVLLDLHSVKTAAKEAHREVCPPLSSLQSQKHSPTSLKLVHYMSGCARLTFIPSKGRILGIVWRSWFSNVCMLV